MELPRDLPTAIALLNAIPRWEAEGVLDEGSARRLAQRAEAMIESLRRLRAPALEAAGRSGATAASEAQAAPPRAPQAPPSSDGPPGAQPAAPPARPEPASVAEEFAKPLGVLLLIRRVGSRKQALLVGVAAGAGFAAVENVFYEGISADEWLG